MKSFIISTLALLFVSLGCNAQEDSYPAFLFDHFQDGEIHLVNGPRGQRKVNYSLLSGTMFFVDPNSGEILELNPRDVIRVTVQGEIFIPVNGVMRQVIAQSPRVSVQYKLVGKQDRPLSAYGTPFNSSSPTIYAQYWDETWKIPLVKDFGLVATGYQNVYWIEKGNRDKMFSNSSQFLKIYKRNKNILKEYITEKNIDFNDGDQVLALIDFAENL